MKNTCIAILILSSLVLFAGCARTRPDIHGGIREDAGDKPSPYSEAYSHYLAGTVYEREGQMDKALVELRKAAELAPNSATLTLRLIRAYLRSEDYANALTMAERAVQQVPDNANLWVVLGEIYHKLDRTGDAVEAFKKAIAIDPDNIIGYGALVTIQEKTNDLVAATDIYKRLAELSPKVGRIHFQLGLCLARMNDSQGARTEMEKAIELSPELTRAHYVLGILYIESGDSAASAKHMEAYVAQNPDDRKARETLAGAHTRLKDYPKAIEQLKKILAGKDAEAANSVELMYVLIQAGDFKQADETGPPQGAPAFSAMMRALARKGAGEPWLPVLQTLDATQTDIDEECTRNLNELLYLFGKKEAGDFLGGFLQEARAASVNSKLVDFILCRILISQERHADAEPILAAAVQQFPGDKQLHYLMAIVYDKLEKVPEAEEQLKAYLKISPNEPEILNFLGYLYADHSIKLDEAESLLKKALEIDPKNAFYMDSLGWVYYRKGNADRAIEFIHKAILAMDNDDAELRNHLGDAYLLKGDKEKALAEWNRALRLNPKITGVKEKIDKQGK